MHDQPATYDEIEDRRRQARINVAVKRSDPLPPRASKDYNPKPNQRRAVDIMARLCTARSGGVYLYGPSGTGKTLLAARAAYRLRERGIPAVFLKAKRALDGMRDFETEGPNGYGKMSDYWFVLLDTAEFLILDDLGAHRCSEFAVEQLTAVFDHRHDHNLATVVTSNLTLTELADKMGDRLADRVRGLCVPVEINGKSNREPSTIG